MRLISAFAISIAFLCAPVSAALLGHWTFEEAAGDTTADLSTSGTTGFITNADTGGLGPNGSVWVDDPVRGSVISFNGAADGAYVSAGTIPQMTLTNDFTWTFWANHDPANTQPNNIILGNRRDETGADFTPRQFIKFTPNNFEWHMNGNGDDNVNYDDLSQIAGVWHHHAVVKTGADLIYYRDGIVTNESTITQPLDVPQPLFFGGDNTMTDGENWMGLLDDVLIFDNALTAAEIVDLAPDAPAPPPRAVPRDIVPTPPVGPGNWNVRVIGIDTRPDGTGDGDINDHQEARDILAYAGDFQGNWLSSGAAAGEANAGGGPSPDEALNLNGWGIYEDNQESRNIIDFGGDNSFAGTHPYPGPETPNLDGTDFLVQATTEEPYHFAPNTSFAINFGSDDGGLLRIEPADGSEFTFTAEPVGSNGDAGLDNQIGFNGNRGHNQTCGEFTTGPDGLIANIEVSMHERGGGDNLEVSIAEGGCAGFGNGPFQLLGDDALITDDGSFLVSVDPNNVSAGGPAVDPSLPCDLDGDGICDTADLNILYAESGDISEWLTQASADDGIEGANEHRLGDANLDGNVDSTDLGLLLNNFNGEGGPAAQWGGGDLNNSGNVDSTDLGLLLNNFNFTSASANAVPEPNSMVLFGLGMTLLLGMRRRRVS